MIYQELDSRKINHFFGGFVGFLIVSCEASESIKPCECSLHYPSERSRGKPLGAVRRVADFNLYFEIGFDFLSDFPTISPVNQYLFESRSKECTCFTQRISQLGIMLSRTVVRARMNPLRSTTILRLMPFTFLLASNPLLLRRLPHFTLWASNAPTVGQSFCLRFLLILMIVFSIKCSMRPSSRHLRKNL